MSRPVRETLAFNAFGNQRRTLLVSCLARIPFEIPFRQIAVQVGLRYGMVCTVDRALHQREPTLCGVSVGKPAEPHVFVRGMVDGAVAGELAPDAKV